MKADNSSGMLEPDVRFVPCPPSSVHLQHFGGGMHALARLVKECTWAVMTSGQPVEDDLVVQVMDRPASPGRVSCALLEWVRMWRTGVESYTFSGWTMDAGQNKNISMQVSWHFQDSSGPHTSEMTFHFVTLLTIPPRLGCVRVMV